MERPPEPRGRRLRYPVMDLAPAGCRAGSWTPRHDRQKAPDRREDSGALDPRGRRRDASMGAPRWKPPGQSSSCSGKHRRRVSISIGRGCVKTLISRIREERFPCWPACGRPRWNETTHARLPRTSIRSRPSAATRPPNSQRLLRAPLQSLKRNTSITKSGRYSLDLLVLRCRVLELFKWRPAPAA